MYKGQTDRLSKGQIGIKIVNGIDTHGGASVMVTYGPPRKIPLPCNPRGVKLVFLPQGTLTRT